MTTIPCSESALVQQIQDGLRWHGFLVLRVGQYRADKAGQTAGTPDLFVRHPGWYPCLWIGGEIKTEKGTLQPAQRVLMQGGHISVWRSLEDALRCLQAVETASVKDPFEEVKQP